METRHMTTDPIDFWSREGTQPEYPHLHALFTNICGIPPTTGNIERLHSIFKFIVGDRRHNISPENLVKVAFVKMNTFAEEYYKMFSKDSQDNELELEHLELDQQNIFHFVESAVRVFGESN